MGRKAVVELRDEEELDEAEAFPWNAKVATAAGVEEAAESLRRGGRWEGWGGKGRATPPDEGGKGGIFHGLWGGRRPGPGLSVSVAG